MTTKLQPIIKLLPSGYWLVKWSIERWVQWPRWREATLADGFDEVTDSDIRAANRLANELEAERDRSMV